MVIVICGLLPSSCRPWARHWIMKVRSVPCIAAARAGSGCEWELLYIVMLDKRTSFVTLQNGKTNNNTHAWDVMKLPCVLDLVREPRVSVLCMWLQLRFYVYSWGSSCRCVCPEVQKIFVWRCCLIAVLCLTSFDCTHPGQWGFVPEMNILVFFSSLTGCRSQCSSTLTWPGHAGYCLHSHPCAIKGNLHKSMSFVSQNIQLKRLYWRINKMSGLCLCKFSLQFLCSRMSWTCFVKWLNSRGLNAIMTAL